ncbi:hypothetical protein D9M69_726680 [compost metagenome]
MGHENHRAVASQDDVFQPRDPVATARGHPVVLVHAAVAVQGFPAALPVVRPAVLPAGQDENVVRFHVKQPRAHILSMRATISVAKVTKAWLPLAPGSKTTPGKP